MNQDVRSRLQQIADDIVPDWEWALMKEIISQVYSNSKWYIFSVFQPSFFKQTTESEITPDKTSSTA